MTMNAAERMNLMRFVCSFAWTDLRVSQAERDLVMRIAGRLGLTDDEAKQVAAWLQVPPAADAVDPTTVPAAHRQLFLHAAQLVTHADGVVPAERDALALFRELLDA
jgi:tellurite resistance protein